MTEWVEIMEDEERLAEIEHSQVRFQVETYFDKISPHVVISSTKKEDQDNTFIGIADVSSKEDVLRIARDGWGISEDEIEFVN